MGHKNKIKLAFSLIELSVVILIVGILVLGITKGTRIIQSVRLTSARALTKGSPVNLNANDLAFWLDTTSEKSFSAAQAIDGASVTTWFDINPHTSNPLNFSGSSVAYVAKYTNSLPALKFSGSMTLGTVPGNTFTKDGKEITIFIVNTIMHPPTNSADLFVWDTSQRILITLDTGTLYFDFGTCCGPTARMSVSMGTSMNNKPIISTFVRRSNGAGRIRINGQQYQTSSTLTDTLNTSLSTNFSIVTDGAPKQYMNEYIVFKRGLSDTEINDVEKYLSSKWGITLKGL